ncbi:MAG TPA: response regulator [Candidatus Acidoferrum sp.]|nr:response regulator [Candidatus Acidoferrum sp.]
MEPLVLVIDDDERMRELISDILTAFNYRVIPAESSAEGLMSAFSQHPDVVLCDLVLPDALGFETAKALSSNEATRDVPVIFITGYPYLRQYSGMENCSILVKPFSMNAVVAAVREAIAKRVAVAPAQP